MFPSGRGDGAGRQLLEDGHASWAVDDAPSSGLHDRLHCNCMG